MSYWGVTPTEEAGAGEPLGKFDASWAKFITVQQGSLDRLSLEESYIGRNGWALGSQSYSVIGQSHLEKTVTSSTLEELTTKRCQLTTQLSTCCTFPFIIAIEQVWPKKHPSGSLGYTCPLP